MLFYEKLHHFFIEFHKKMGSYIILEAITFASSLDEAINNAYDCL